MGDVIVAEGDHLAAGQPRARPQTGMRQFVDQHQIGTADQARNDAGIGQIARAEDAGGFGALQPRQPRFQLGEQRMIAGDQPRGAGAGAIAFQRGDRRLFDRGMMGEIEIVVAGEGQEPPAVARDPEAVLALGFRQRAAQMPALQFAQLLAGELIERGHNRRAAARGGRQIVHGSYLGRYRFLPASETECINEQQGARRQDRLA